MLTLYGHPGWGSTIIEAQLRWYDVPYAYEDAGDVFKDSHARRKLMTLNGVAQVPTVILSDGAVMTESAAITFHLADVTGRDDLVPGAQDVTRARFLRWLIFIVANIYPTFTYVDDPGRFVSRADAQEDYVNQVSAYRKRLWRIMETEVKGPWFLGDRFSAIDIYIAVMNHWQPRADWFAEQTPAMHAIAGWCARDPVLRPAFQKNFPGSPHWQV